MKKPYLPNGSRPARTGQGLTPTQFKYFKKRPRDMQEIANDLFDGDFWAASAFQNRFIGAAVLGLNEDATIFIIDWDAIDKEAQ